MTYDEISMEILMAPFYSWLNPSLEQFTMSPIRLSMQTIDNCRTEEPSATPRRDSTIAEHFMRRTTVNTRDLLGQHDREWVSNQLGSLRPFPPDY